MTTETITIAAHTTCTLSSGLRIANFSSPHPFTFEDGTVLPACSPERAKALELDVQENPVGSSWPGTVNIELTPTMTAVVAAELEKLENDEGVDVVLIPLMVMAAIKACHGQYKKARVQRSVSRVSKAVSGTKWCV